MARSKDIRSISLDLPNSWTRTLKKKKKGYQDNKSIMEATMEIDKTVLLNKIRILLKRSCKEDFNLSTKEVGYIVDRKSRKGDYIMIKIAMIYALSSILRRRKDSMDKMPLLSYEDLGDLFSMDHSSITHHKKREKHRRKAEIDLKYNMELFAGGRSFPKILELASEYLGYRALWDIGSFGGIINPHKIKKKVILEIYIDNKNDLRIVKKEVPLI